MFVCVFLPPWLQQILACLLPNNPDFATLPPHFNILNTLDDAHVPKGHAHVVWANSFQLLHDDKSNDLTPVILSCFACVRQHIKSLIDTIGENPGHDFATASCHCFSIRS